VGKRLYRELKNQKRHNSNPLAQIESVVEPDWVGNNIWREAMAFIGIHGAILTRRATEFVSTIFWPNFDQPQYTGQEMSVVYYCIGISFKQGAFK
jgi:hypothetical protein